MASLSFWAKSWRWMTHTLGARSATHEWKKQRLGRGTVGKTAVVRAVQRDGSTIVEPVPAVTHEELEMFLIRNVQTGTFVFADEQRSYAGLDGVGIWTCCGVAQHRRICPRTGSHQQRRVVLVHVQTRHATVPCHKMSTKHLATILQRIRQKEKPQAKTHLGVNATPVPATH